MRTPAKATYLSTGTAKKAHMKMEPMERAAMLEVPSQAQKEKSTPSELTRFHRIRNVRSDFRGERSCRKTTDRGYFGGS